LIDRLDDLSTPYNQFSFKGVGILADLAESKGKI